MAQLKADLSKARGKKIKKYHETEEKARRNSNDNSADELTKQRNEIVEIVAKERYVETVFRKVLSRVKAELLVTIQLRREHHQPGSMASGDQSFQSPLNGNIYGDASQNQSFGAQSGGPDAPAPTPALVNRGDYAPASALVNRGDYAPTFRNSDIYTLAPARNNQDLTPQRLISKYPKAANHPLMRELIARDRYAPVPYGRLPADSTIPYGPLGPDLDNDQ